jgi:hypothetical protein
MELLRVQENTDEMLHSEADGRGRYQRLLLTQRKARPGTQAHTPIHTQCGQREYREPNQIEYYETSVAPLVSEQFRKLTLEPGHEFLQRNAGTALRGHSDRLKERFPARFSIDAWSTKHSRSPRRCSARQSQNPPNRIVLRLQPARKLHRGRSRGIEEVPPWFVHPYFILASKISTLTGGAGRCSPNRYGFLILCSVSTENNLKLLKV